MEQTPIVALVLDFIKFVFYLGVTYFLRKFFPGCSRIIHFILTGFDDEQDSKVSRSKQRECSCVAVRNVPFEDPKNRDVTDGDIKLVLQRLGMAGDEEDSQKGISEEAVKLLEEKEASLEDLKEAFYVFDRNEDGYITAEELWSVLRRLGFEEGARIIDCRPMIAAYDEDGDGRISFTEFRSMMDGAM